jgi:long-chain acyl-CoA synthetase
VNLAHMQEDHYNEHGDYEAVHFEGKWFSTGEALARSKAVAAGLAEIGVQPGDRVAVMLPNCPEVGLSYWGIWRIGAAATPIIFLLPPPEINRILAHSGAKVAITSPEFLANLQTAAEGVDTLEKIVCVDGGGEGVIPFSELETSGTAEIVEREPDDLAALLYTGGTTGASKGVMLSHNNLEWTARVAAAASEYQPGTKGLLALPLSHGFGLHVSILNAIQPGSSVLMRWFEPNMMLDLIDEHRVERMAVVPTMLQMLLALPLEERDLSCLTSITSGAAALPIEVLKEFERRVPSCKIVQGYGLTETSPTVAVQPPSTAADGTRAIGSVGPVVEGVEVRIVSESGEPQPVGEVGEIAVKGPNVMLGYWNNEEATSAAIPDGWFRTGDVGKLDEKGNLYIVERVKDLIIRGGFNVFPNDVEGALLEHPAIAEAAVVGRPDETWGEEPVAFVVFKPGSDATPEDVLEFCEQRLAKYKRPVEVRPVGMIPKTPVGKIDKKLLRADL